MSGATVLSLVLSSKTPGPLKCKHCLGKTTFVTSRRSAPSPPPCPPPPIRKIRNLFYHEPYATIRYHMVPYGTIWYHMIPYGTIWYWDITEPEHGHLWKNTYFLTDLDFHDIYPACQLVLFRHEYVYQKFEYTVFLCYKVWLKPRWYKNIKRSLGAILQYLPSSEPHVVHGARCFTMPHLDSGFASNNF